MKEQKSSGLALRIAVNSFAVVVGAISLIQVYTYVRDGIMLGTGSLATFLANYVGYMGSRILPLAVFFVLVIFFYARTIQSVIVRLEAGERLVEATLLRARRRTTRLRMIIVVINII